MSLKWQNSIFYCLPNKGYQFWQLPIWKSASVEVRESSREVPVYQWVKKSKINQTLMRVRGTVLFYQCHFNHKMAQLSAKRKLLGLQFLPWGKLRAFKWTSGFPSCVEYCQKKKNNKKKKHLFLAPFRALNMLHDWVQEQTERIAAKGLRWYQGDSDLTDHL